MVVACTKRGRPRDIFRKERARCSFGASHFPGLFPNGLLDPFAADEDIGSFSDHGDGPSHAGPSHSLPANSSKRPRRSSSGLSLASFVDGGKSRKRRSSGLSLASFVDGGGSRKRQKQEKKEANTISFMFNKQKKLELHTGSKPKGSPLWRNRAAAPKAEAKAEAKAEPAPAKGPPTRLATAMAGFLRIIKRPKTGTELLNLPLPPDSNNEGKAEAPGKTGVLNLPLPPDSATGKNVEAGEDRPPLCSLKMKSPVSAKVEDQSAVALKSETGLCPAKPKSETGTDLKLVEEPGKFWGVSRMMLSAGPGGGVSAGFLARYRGEKLGLYLTEREAGEAVLKAFRRQAMGEWL